MREQRVAEALREELSDIIKNQIKDPRVGFMSVTAVSVTQDLRTAKVSVSVLGSQKDQELAFKALTKATGFVRTELAKRVSMRFVPELVFRLDTSLEHSIRISKLLNEMSAQQPEQRTEAGSKEDEHK